MKKSFWVSAFVLAFVLAAVTTFMAACSSNNSPSSPSATATPTSIPCVYNGTPCTTTPSFTPTQTGTPTNTATITLTPTVTATPTNSLSAFVTLGSATYFNNLGGLRYSNGSLWVVDSNNENLQQWATNGGSPVTTVTTFNGAETFSSPWSDGIDPSTGNVYLADGDYGALANMQSETFDPFGNYLNTFGNSQMGAGVTADPDGVAVNSSGTTVYVVGETTNLVYVYSISGSSPYTYTHQFNFGQSGSGAATLNNPYSLFVDSSNNVWVSDYNDAMAKEYSPSGNFIQGFTSSDLADVSDVAVDGSGNVYVTDDSNSFVLKFNSSGTPVAQFGAGILSSPEGITVDGLGNIYVSDTSNKRIVGFH